MVLAQASGGPHLRLGPTYASKEAEAAGGHSQWQHPPRHRLQLSVARETAVRTLWRAHEFSGTTRANTAGSPGRRSQGDPANHRHTR